MCDWATCNFWLHFSGTLPGSARRTGLLPVCGRNLYNWLCSFFFCSLHYPLHIDSELTQTLNYFRLWTWGQLSRTLKKKFPKTQFNPPFLWFFSPSHMTRHNAYVHTNNSPHHHQSFSIYAFTNNSPSLDIYTITNNIHNSINIYVFTNNVTINQHICIHNNCTINQHTVSHIPSKGENTSY